jgi:hypothetical protein
MSAWKSAFELPLGDEATPERPSADGGPVPEPDPTDDVAIVALPEVREKRWISPFEPLLHTSSPEAVEEEKFKEPDQVTVTPDEDVIGSDGQRHEDTGAIRQEAILERCTREPFDEDTTAPAVRRVASERGLFERVGEVLGIHLPPPHDERGLFERVGKELGIHLPHVQEHAHQESYRFGGDHCPEPHGSAGQHDPSQPDPSHAADEAGGHDGSHPLEDGEEAASSDVDAADLGYELFGSTEPDMG